MCVRGAACDWYKGVRSRCKWVECSSVKPNQRKRKRNELERKWERGCGSVWSSQPGLLSHLQPLSLFYTQIHAHTDTVHILSLTHTHTCPRTGWQPHDTATTHHSMPLLYPLNHSLANHMQINIPLSSGHIHHVNNEQSTTPPDFLAIPMVISKSMTVLLFYALLLSSLEVFPFGIVALLIQFFSKLPKLLHICFYPKWFIRAYISYIQHSILSSNHDALVLCPAGRKLYASF